MIPETFDRFEDWAAPQYADDDAAWKYSPEEFIARFPDCRVLMGLRTSVGTDPLATRKGRRIWEWTQKVMALRPGHYEVGIGMRTSTGIAFAHGATVDHVQKIPLEVWHAWYQKHLLAGWRLDLGAIPQPIRDAQVAHMLDGGESFNWHGHAFLEEKRWLALKFAWDWSGENFRPLAIAHARHLLDLHERFGATVFALGGKLGEELPLRRAFDGGHWLEYHKHSKRVRCAPEEGAELGCDPAFAPAGRMVWGTAEPYQWLDQVARLIRDYLPGFARIIVPGTDADDPRLRHGAWCPPELRGRVLGGGAAL